MSSEELTISKRVITEERREEKWRGEENFPRL